MIPALPGDIFHQGQVLNSTWTIEGVLGRGGSGEVYRAKNLVTGRVVAIKVLAAQFSGDEGYLEMMRREEAMRDIVHDAVVRYSECSRSAEGHVFLVMDFIDGPALSDVMVTRRMEPRELLILAHRVAEGLVAAHARGVIHRDLSPDNIILRDGQAERAVLIDFGIAKDTVAGARTIVGNQFAGKYEYAAPEQFEGKAVPASDLYALGATMAAAARGEIPSAGETPAEMIRRKAEPLDVSDLPEPLAGLIRWLCAPRLSDRAPSAAAVVARLDTLLKGQAQSPARRGAGNMARSRTKGGGAWLIALLLVAALAGGGLLWWQFSSDRLPLVEPWRLEAQAGPPPVLAGQAPNQESADRIAAAFTTAAGAAAPPETLPLARGMPAPGWDEAMAQLFPALDGLRGWTVVAEGLSVAIAGAAGSQAERNAIATRLQAWAQAAGFELELNLTAPAMLMPDPVAALLSSHAACGPLTSDIPAAGVPESGTVTITGSLPDAAAQAALAEALAALLGTRQLRLNTELLSPSLCLIRAAMAGLPDAGLSIRLTEARRAEPSLTGIFRPGDNPVADVLISPELAAASGAELWVALEADGAVHHILPSMENGETRLNQIGQDEGALRVVRVLWPNDATEAPLGSVAINVNDEDFGKAGLFAFISQGPLFPERRPGDESAASFAEALTALRAAGDDPILGATYRVLDLRS